MDQLIRQIVAFRDARNWQQYHNVKDLALSLNLEASELLELFQWKSSEEAVSVNSEEMVHELGDILIYALLLCYQLQLDPTKVIMNKLALNDQKYPVEKAYGSNKKYGQL